MADIILGTDTQTGKPVVMDNKDRVRGNYIIGRTGSGKSIFLEQLAVQDAGKGHGFCFLDPAGDVLKHILCRIPQERIDRGDVIFLDPLDYEFPFGLNLYECKSSDPATMRDTYNQVEQIFAKVFGMSKETPRLSQFVRNITATMLYNQGMTMCEIPLLLQDEGFRARMVANLLTGSPARLFWKAYDALRPMERLDRAESTLDRIDALINNEILYPIVGQSKTTIDFVEIMNSSKILLVKLPGKDEDITTLLGSVIINQLLLAALSRESIPENKRRQFNIYADEFQRFAVPSFGQLLIEARKYRIATICANQVLNDLGEQLRPRMLNAGCLVVLNVQDEDATDLAGEFNYAPPPAVKPKPIVPANVLDHLNRHQNQEVRDFYKDVTASLELAERKHPTYETRSGERYAEHDFGEGYIQYNLNNITKVRPLLNDLLYEALENNRVDLSLYARVLRLVAPCWCFADYYNIHYVSAPKSDPAGVEGELLLKEAKIAKDEAMLASDKAFLTFLAQAKWYTLVANKEIGLWGHQGARSERTILNRYLHGSSIWDYLERWPERRTIPVRGIELTQIQGETEDEIWASMQQVAAENAALRSLDSYEKWLEAKKAVLPQWFSVVLTLKDPTTFDDRPFTLEKCLTSEEFILAFPDVGHKPGDGKSRSYWEYYHKIADLCASYAASDTAEKVLALNKDAYRQSEIQPRIAKREKLLHLLEIHRQGIGAEIELFAEKDYPYPDAEAVYRQGKERHDRFVERLDEVLHILISPEGKIEVPSTQWQETILVQQTHTDKRAEIANALNKLPVGRAWVRLTKPVDGRNVVVEHVIDIPMPSGFSEKELERKKIQVVEYTRKHYCKPRAEVEEEIRRRQSIDTQPITKRRGI